MPALVGLTSNRRIPLGARCLVGRGPLVHVRLQESTVSAEHASVYFDDGVWKVRDLGSRNGTYLNGQRLDVRSARALSLDDELAFGGPRQEAWRLDSQLPPGPAARSANGAVTTGAGGVLWLFRNAEPEACVRFQAGVWTLEGATGSRTVVDGDTLTLAGATYVLELPPWQASGLPAAESTLEAGAASDARLCFVTSRDQEHISLDVVLAGRRIPLGARAHNAALLCLARRRLVERKSGISESECGWLYADELRDALQLDRVALNLQLWRATQALKKFGLSAEKLIERRLDAQQLRIGFSDLLVEEE
jgi:FHA domain